MANAIKVTPDTLRSVGDQIDHINDQYKNCYNNIYNEVSELTGNNWGGDAQRAYNDRIDGFRNDFQNLYNLLNNYCTYLRNTAAKYDQIEGEITQATSSLNTGI